MANKQPKMSQAGFIWACTTFILIAMLATGFVTGFGVLGWATVSALLGFAMLSYIAENRGARPAAEQVAAKAKRDEGSISPEMLALLSEDDLAELRERIKRRLIDQIETGDPEDMESFEQLLTSRERLKRK